MVYKIMLPRAKQEDTHEQGASFPLGITLELCEELLGSILTWTVPYKLLLTDQKRATWFVDSSSTVNGQTSCLKGYHFAQRR